MALKFGVFIALGLASLTQPATAAISTFSNQADFMSATKANSASGALPDVGYISSGSITLGSLTFNQVNDHGIYVGTAGTGLTNWSNLTAANLIAINDTENLDIVSNSQLFSFGFEFIEPSQSGGFVGSCFVNNCQDSTFSVTLKNGSTLVDSFSFNATNDVLAFIGVWSDQAFDHVEIRETAGGIDDEFYGQFYTGTTAVPVPTSAWLFASGLMAVAGRRKQTA